MNNKQPTRSNDVVLHQILKLILAHHGNKRTREVYAAQPRAG